MKTIIFLVLISLVTLNISCNKKDEINSTNYSTIEDFCNIAPKGWQATVMTKDYGPRDTIWGASTPPLFVIKYILPSIEFKRYDDVMVNPSLVLNFYSIERKQELIDLIIAQKDFYWCVTWYYGETERYFIVTSPCFINHGHLEGEEAEPVKALDKAIKKIVVVNKYFQTCNESDRL